MAFKDFFSKLFRRNQEPKIQLVDEPTIGSANFHLILGFDVDMDHETHTVKIFVNKQVLTAEGERAKNFLNSIASGELKFIVSDLCSAAAKHVLTHGDKVTRAEVQVPVNPGPHLPN